MQTGVIDKWVFEKGFGFVESVDGNRWFFPSSSVIGAGVTVGDEVEFETGPGKCDGETIAINVRRIGAPALEEPGRLFVSNLPRFSSRDDAHTAVLEAFQTIAAVLKVEIVVDPESREPKGFCFVQMQNPEDAAECIRQFDGMEWGNRILSVRPSVKKSSMARRA